jgi:hypothetical protein
MSAKKGKRPLLEVGARVFAKVRGYPAWPARVEEHQGGSGNSAKYKVFFYGTYESATVKATDVWPFDEKTKNKFGKQKRKGFAEALDEIEKNPGIQTAEMLDNAMAAVMGEAAAEPAVAAAVAAAAATDVPAPAEEPESIKDEEEGRGELQIDDGQAKTPAKPVRAQRKSGKSHSTLLLLNWLLLSWLHFKGAATEQPTRGTKRKAADAASAEASPATPAAKLAKVVAPAVSEPVTPLSTPATPASVERTSRSGRVIKPKKFVDEVKAQGTPKVLFIFVKFRPNQVSKAHAVFQGDDKVASSNKKDRKVYIEIKATGDVIELNLDNDRPTK